MLRLPRRWARMHKQRAFWLQLRNFRQGKRLDVPPLPNSTASLRGSEVKYCIKFFCRVSFANLWAFVVMLCSENDGELFSPFVFVLARSLFLARTLVHTSSMTFTIVT